MYHTKRTHAVAYCILLRYTNINMCCALYNIYMVKDDEK